MKTRNNSLLTNKYIEMDLMYSTCFKFITAFTSKFKHKTFVKSTQNTQLIQLESLVRCLY